VAWRAPGLVVAAGGLALAGYGLWAADGRALALALAFGVALVAVRWLGGRHLLGVEPGLRVPRVLRAGAASRMGVELCARRGWLDARGVELEFAGPGGVDGRLEVGWVPAGEVGSWTVAVRARHRAAGERFEWRLASGFPWGWFRFERAGACRARLSVLPRERRPRAWSEVRGALDEALPGRGAAAGRALGMRGLREFRGGDAVSAVAWSASSRSLARGGGLLVRDPEPPGRLTRRVRLVFHSHGGGGRLIQPARFERALALLWGTIHELRERGVELEWRADFDGWAARPLNHRRELAEAGLVLAAASRMPATEAHELGAELEAAAGDSCVVISDMAPEDWASARRRGVIVLDPEARGRGWGDA